MRMLLVFGGRGSFATPVPAESSVSMKGYGMGPRMGFGVACILGGQPNTGLLTESGRSATLGRSCPPTGQPVHPYPYRDNGTSSQTAHKAPYSPVGGFVVCRHLDQEKAS